MPVHQPLTDWLRPHFVTPVFAGYPKRELLGYPPRTPDFMLGDCAIHGVLQRRYEQISPQTIPAAMKVVQTILDDMQNAGAKWVEHLDALYEEVVDKNGGASHLM